MRHEWRRVVALCALVFVRAAEANGQPTLAGVGEVIRPGNAISVTSRNSEEARGRLIRISPASLVLDVKGRQREFFVEDIGWVERTGDPLWNGAIIGGVIVGWGFAGGAGASCSPNCGRDVPRAMLAGTAIGAGVGALFDAMHSGSRRLFGTRPHGARSQLSDPNPVTALADLWSRLRRGDTVYVLDAEGQQTVARFYSASSSGLVLTTNGQAQTLEASQVRSVHRRTTQLARGLLFGPLAGAVAGGIANRGCSNCGRAGNAATGAIRGLLVGAVVGELIPHRAVVYQQR
jgi:hypothetical protein